MLLLSSILITIDLLLILLYWFECLNISIKIYDSLCWLISYMKVLSYSIFQSTSANKNFTSNAFNRECFNEFRVVYIKILLSFDLSICHPLGMPLLQRDMDAPARDPPHGLLHSGWKADLRPTGDDGHPPKRAGSMCLPQMRALICLILVNWIHGRAFSNAQSWLNWAVLNMKWAEVIVLFLLGKKHELNKR